MTPETKNLLRNTLDDAAKTLRCARRAADGVGDCYPEDDEADQALSNLQVAVGYAVEALEELKDAIALLGGLE